MVHRGGNGDLAKVCRSDITVYHSFRALLRYCLRRFDIITRKPLPDLCAVNVRDEKQRCETDKRIDSTKAETADP